MSKGLTREEAYWARMSGEPIETPEPITRKDAYMQKAAEKVNAAAAELPAVTTADKYKLLTVNAKGEWSKNLISPNTVAPVGVGEVGVLAAFRKNDGEAIWATGVKYETLPYGNEKQYLKYIDGKWRTAILDDPTFITEKVVGKMTEPPVIELAQDGKALFEYYQVILLQGKDTTGFPMVTGILHNIYDSLGQWIEPSLADGSFFKSNNSQSGASMTTLFSGVTHSKNPATGLYTTVTFTPKSNVWCTNSTKMIIKGWIPNDHL